MTAEPLLEDAVQETVACPAPATAVTPVGMAGAPEIAVLLDALEGEELPWPLVATTVKV